MQYRYAATTSSSRDKAAPYMKRRDDEEGAELDEDHTIAIERGRSDRRARDADSLCRRDP